MIMEVEDEEPVLPLFLLPRPTLRKREDRSWKEEFVDLMRGNPSPEVAAYHEEQRQYMFQRYLSLVAPLLRAIVAEDNADTFLDLHAGRSQFMGPGRLLYPEILCTMVSSNALRCAKVALEGGVPLAYCRADPNARHSYGFTPLHMAAETFSVPMLNLLFRYGASANIPTKGDLVIENLLPLNVAVENASMHKYLEDHWDHGHPVQNLIALPEMVPHAEIVEHVSSILNSNGVVHFGKGIDTGNLECYRHCGQMLNTKPGSQRVDGRTNEADKSSPLKNEGSERILAKQPLRLATKHARNMFFPFWKSVLSARLPVKISPPSCTGPTQSTFQLSFTSNSGLIKMELSATREWLYPAFLQAVLWFILCLKPF